MKAKLLTIILLLSAAVLYAQFTDNSGAQYCHLRKISSGEPVLPLWDSPNTPKHKFDVLDYKIFVDIYNCFLSPYPRTFTGNVIIKFRVDTALNSITLNAVNRSLQVNAVSIAGVSFTHTSNILTINLDRTYNPNEIVNMRIDYQHLNVVDSALYVSNGFVYTDFPPEGARKVFPCWDKPSDKASLDLTARVPITAKLGSNGRLNDSLVTGDTVYYHWISRDPIATYLIVFTGKVGYNLELVYWPKISNPNDSIPIRFYWNSGENITAAKQRIIPMTTYYSQKFGEYPFEKGGFATLNSQFPWGGMENQTLISLMPHGWTEDLMVHEYAHMWFGDLVTCGTWADVWLNEGFATYCEALWRENTGGYSAYKLRVNGFASTYLNTNPGWPIYNPAWAEVTPPPVTLYNYAITYCKGAGVLHMLRYTIGDSLFFAFLNAYATDTTDFKHKNAVTDDLTAKLNQVTGQDYSWFMNQWVKQPNHPVYQNTYNITGAGTSWTVGFIAKQTQTNTPFHKMPITVKITFASGPDSTIRTMNDTNNQVYYWTFNRQPTAFQFDPNNDIVLKQGSTTIGLPGESEVPFTYKLYQNYPNPFNPFTRIRYDIPLTPQSIKGVKEGRGVYIKLIVYDILGREVVKLVDELKKPGSHFAEFDGTNLPSGVYFYRIKAGDPSASSGQGFNDVKKMVLIK
jgi:aminopeptidase N